MLLDIVLFVVGITLIVVGANYMTDGSAALARRLGLSPMMVGLTIVAFGTSAPEFIVSFTSALKGSSDISLGNVLGSNIFNVLAIGGITAIIAPLRITRNTIRREMPLMLLASIVLTAMALDTIFSGLPAPINVVSRSEGIVLLAFFAIFLAYTIAISKDGVEPHELHVAQTAQPTAEDAQPTEVAPPKRQRPMWILILFIIGGLATLVIGGELFVNAASSIARSFGVSEALIGLTLVAAGTSMPELATSIAAALKGEHELAVGNIVGSGIFNIFLILGLTSAITPIRVAGISVLDFGVLIFSALLIYLLGVFFGRRTISRLEGGVLFAGYIAYTVYLITQA